MADFTAGWGLPYSQLSDSVNFNGNIQALAEAVDTALTDTDNYISSVETSLGTLTTNVPEIVRDTMNTAIVTDGEHSGIVISFSDVGDYMDFVVDVATPTERGILHGLSDNAVGSNTALGGSALSTVTTGTNNLGLGYNAQTSSASASNQVVLGNSSVTVIRAQVTSITSLSDQRDKRFIEDIPVGLAFINSLRPVKFEWNTRDGAKVGIPDMGFIAQDLAIAENKIDAHDWLQLTYRDNPDKLEASYGRLVPVLVKAIQELAERVADLESDLFFATKG